MMSDDPIRDDLTRVEDQRGTSRVMMWGGVAAVIVCVVAVAWLFLPAAQHPDTAGQRTAQTQGVSTAGRDTSAPPASRPNDASPETVGRAQDIQRSSSGEQPLERQQVQAVKQFAASAQSVPSVTFTLSVGAAVPREQPLQDMPRALGEALPNYTNDQYLVVGNQFVIVEKNTRRIIAIVPIA